MQSSNDASVFSSISPFTNLTPAKKDAQLFILSRQHARYATFLKKKKGASFDEKPPQVRCTKLMVYTAEGLPGAPQLHIFIAYPAAFDEDSFELDSFPPERFEELTLAFFVSEIFEDILSMYSWVMLAIFDV